MTTLRLKLAVASLFAVACAASSYTYLERNLRSHSAMASLIGAQTRATADR